MSQLVKTGAPIAPLKQRTQSRKRNTSIELLKIVSMAMIVLCHTVQTLGADSNIYVPFHDYVLDLDASTGNVQRLLLSMITYFGAVGNICFFLCSAWFLLDSNRSSKRKIFQMLADIWVVSFCILLVVAILKGGHISGALVIRQLFPTLFGNNWYMTCYILFLAIHPFLNKIIQQVSQRTLLRISGIMFILYSVCDYFNPLIQHFIEATGFFFSSSLIVWIMMYFIMAYIKNYLPDTAGGKRLNLICFLVGFLGLFGTILLTNVLGRRLPLFDGILLIWNTKCNPFMLLMVLGVFNLVRVAEFYSKIINDISRLTLFIYIIHENLLLRKLYRPAMWQYAYQKYGYDHVLLLALCLAAIIFVFALLTSMLYDHTIHKLIVKLCDRWYPKLRTVTIKLENSVCKLR